MLAPIQYTEKWNRPFVPAEAIEVGDRVDLVGEVLRIEEVEIFGRDFFRFYGTATLGGEPIVLLAEVGEPVVLPHARPAYAG